jgi:hypothetical protein
VDRIAELVRLAQPETVTPPLEVQTRQRAAFLRSMSELEGPHVRSRPWPRTAAAWAAALVGAAAGAVLVALLLPGSSPPHARQVTPAVLTAIRKGLAGISADVERLHSSVPGAPMSVTSWVDLRTGACRADTWLRGHRLLTLYDEGGRAVLIDYGRREWWSRADAGVVCEPLTPWRIEHDLTTGRYVLAGNTVIDGRRALKLESRSTSTGPHPVSELTTLWVNAETYVPIRSTSQEHSREQTVFTWLPPTRANTAALTVTVPTGFHKVSAPPPQSEPVP